MELVSSSAMIQRVEGRTFEVNAPKRSVRSRYRDVDPLGNTKLVVI